MPARPTGHRPAQNLAEQLAEHRDCLPGRRAAVGPGERLRRGVPPVVERLQRPCDGAVVEMTIPCGT
ncbi:MAG: hypothetical protein ACK56I_20915, partial [bacterium]